MPAKSEKPEIVKAKIKLGKLVAKCRENKMSQRQLANAVGLSPSNMKYIEDGVNCPTAEIYSKLINSLNPSEKHRAELDQAYMTIRNTPPPDVCERVKNDAHLIDIIRAMESIPLTELQAQQIMAVINSFESDNSKGDNNNG